ncbi:MAG TPA: UvrD-helicase domain-containing protein [Nitrospiria bacterium]|nr:UvrD-helicase domain-containing protein [Nitrospiria bacterium]
MNSAHFLDQLNPPQRRAVERTEGPLLVLAGAGSGKTRVIAARIAYLIASKGVLPAQILAVTFTNKAAGEMRERVAHLLGVRSLGVWVSTFHSACVRILRQHADRLGYEKSFQIYDTADQLAVVKEGTKELQLDPERYKPSALLGRISWAKNHLMTPDAFERTAASFGLERAAARLYPWYQERLRRHQAIDFDDLLQLSVRLFDEHPAVLEAYQQRFRYLLIDEFQDTNPVQYRWVRQLTGRHQNLCVVGDDDQSIYRFRGADVGNILRFEQDFPSAEVILLEQNYRSTQTILDAAMAVVSGNASRKPKQLWTDNRGGPLITRCRASDDETEADYIARTIDALQRTDGLRYGDCCVLYRTNAQSRSLEEGLRRRGIPYQIIGGVRFYERKEIKDLLAYLRVIVNPQDRVGLLRILNVPARGIGATTIERIEQAAAAWGLPLADAIGRLLDAPAEAEAAGVVLASAPRRALAEFRSVLRDLRRRYEQLEPGSASGGLTGLLDELLRRTGYQEWLRQEFGPAAEPRIENIQELFSAIEEFEERLFEDDNDRGRRGEAVPHPEQPERILPAFLDQVALVSDVDDLNGEEGAVLLMTLHSAKGLEFPAVFLAGMEEGLFPHARSLAEPVEMEEERRLCYVGMTRAKQRLYLIHTEMRRLYGSVQWNPPSRFLDEVPEELLESVFEGVAPFDAGMAAPTAMNDHVDDWTAPDAAPDFESLQAGARVRHPVWGIGTIRLSEGRGERQKVVVHFASVGVKKLLVRQARLERA